MDKQIGIIGVGLMGHGIALNILKHGWQLGFLNHPGNQPNDDLIGLGAKAFDDRSELANISDIIILCVTGTPQIEEILLGEDGILTVVQPGTIIVDCSTAIPSSTQKIAEAAQAVGAQFLDAAMTRTPREAEDGRLNLLVGGDEQTYHEILPLFSCFSENQTYAGATGAGHKIKLLHNYVALGSITLLAEAAACAQAGGIDPAVFVDVLKKGGGHGAALDRLAPYILENDPTALQFSINNALKDLSYYVAMSGDEKSPNGIAESVKSALADLVKAGAGPAYVSQLPEKINLLKDK